MKEHGLQCRTPPGVRGLKPSLGRRYGYGGCGRTPPGVRGLKPTWEFRYFTSVSRTPPGVRGLKHEMNANLLLPLRSHPAQGAWIETIARYSSSRPAKKSHPTRGAWIET